MPFINKEDIKIFEWNTLDGLELTIKVIHNEEFLIVAGKDENENIYILKFEEKFK